MKFRFVLDIITEHHFVVAHQLSNMTEVVLEATAHMLSGNFEKYFRKTSVPKFSCSPFYPYSISKSPDSFLEKTMLLLLTCFSPVIHFFCLKGDYVFTTPSNTHDGDCENR